MRVIRAELGGKLRKQKITGVTAARLKGMKSIRKKLATGRLTLYQIQDIGGCRAMLPTHEDAAALLDVYLPAHRRVI